MYSQKDIHVYTYITTDPTNVLGGVCEMTDKHTHRHIKTNEIMDFIEIKFKFVDTDTLRETCLQK